MKVLLDTTVLIDALAGQEEAMRTLERLQQSGDILHTSTINLFEVFSGICRSERRQAQRLQALEVLSSNIRVLAIDTPSAQKGAQIHARLSKMGKGVGSPDCLIAGCAVANGVEAIVTRNQKHFADISEIKKIIVY